MLNNKKLSSKKLLLLTGNHERIVLLNLVASYLKVQNLDCDIYAILQFGSDKSALEIELFDGIIVEEALPRHERIFPKINFSEQQIHEMLSRDRYADNTESNAIRVAKFSHEISELMSRYKYILGIGEVSWWTEEVVARLCYDFQGEYLSPSSLRLIERRWFLAPAMSEEVLVDRISVKNNLSEKPAALIESRPDYFKAGIAGVKLVSRISNFRISNLLDLFSSQKKLRLLFAKIQQLATMMPGFRGIDEAELLEIKRVADKIYFFPLHTQPEASVDYLAPKFRDQFKLIWELSQTLQANEYIAVKSHPGALHEFNLLNRLSLGFKKKIIFIRAELDISTLFYVFDGCISITGTLAAQFAIAGVPSVTLAPLFFNAHPLCNYTTVKSWRMDIDAPIDYSDQHFNKLFLKSLTDGSLLGHTYYDALSGFDSVYVNELAHEIFTRVDKSFTSEFLPRFPKC